MSAGPTQWQLVICPYLSVKEIISPDLAGRMAWTGVFARVKIPKGNFRRNLGHSVWVHVYARSGYFYQVGFLESNKSRAEGEPNTTTWRAFYSTTQRIGDPRDKDSVFTFHKFANDKEFYGERGEEYSLYIEMDDDFITLSVRDKNGAILGTINLPDTSKVLRGGEAGPEASFTLEGLTTYPEDDWGDVEPFVIRNLMLQGDERKGTDFPTKYLRVEIQINVPPPFLGIKRINENEILIGKGLPRQTVGTV